MADEDESEEGGGSKKKLIIIIVAALLLVGISVGVTFMLLGGDDPAAAEVAPEEVKPEKGDPVYIELKPFTVNLAPEDPVGFLQVEINILTYFSEVSEDLEKHKPLIRNNLTVLFSQQQSADLRSPEGKAALQKKVLDTIQEAVDKYGSGGKVDSVFFYNFVMQ